ncbi:heavy metal-associated isoprenylated plant protein 4 isoform X1 [Andrographis paniculata]|uniref:heavy metal-associated isoprenylated plant protein 4 isoform X1 n=1 Tax=Andrographis paniculata TaxID=175694 RepID=UPI0021E8E7D2|nr:heavy metal-associated isoprenylated plant protein 4 isoform X1 [Andrographis paniculata]
MTKEEKKLEVITVVYKAYLHCPKCAHDIKKPLLRIQVTGAIDAKKVQTLLQKRCKKVEIIFETKVKAEEIKKKENIKSITLKAYFHCNECEREVRRRLLVHKEIHNVKTDMKAQTITVEGVIENEKLVAYMKKKLHKYAEIKKQEEKKTETKVEVKKKKETEDDGDQKVVKEFEEVKKVEAKPYFIHYVYAPQLFSDENPNSCSIL